MDDSLVGAAEVARLLKVTRQRVNALAKTYADFPAPRATLAAGKIWLKRDIEAWARRHERFWEQDGPSTTAP